MALHDRYTRILLKLSGEAMSGEGRFGIDPEQLVRTAGAITAALSTGAEIAVVCGGGNIIRGAPLAAGGTVDREAADHMGMLGTVVNGVALQSALRREGVRSRLMSAVEVRGVARSYRTADAIRAMERREIVILAAGTGHPYFTTDTGAALRAAQRGCGAILKATKVDGVYSADPKSDADAIRFESLSFDDAVRLGLAVMDETALTMCRDNGIAAVVFDFGTEGSIRRVLEGEPIGTLIHP